MFKFYNITNIKLIKSKIKHKIKSNNKNFVIRHKNFTDYYDKNIKYYQMDRENLNDLFKIEKIINYNLFFNYKLKDYVKEIYKKDIEFLEKNKKIIKGKIFN